MQERRHRDLPAAADVAEQVLARNVHVREEDLVELRLARDLPQRAHLHAGRVHVDDDVRQARVALRLRVAAADKDAEVREVRERGPDLLAVDGEPVVPRLDARAHGGEIGSCSGSEKPWHQISSDESIFAR